MDCLEGLGSAFSTVLTPTRELRETERQLARMQEREWAGDYDYSETRWMHGLVREYERRVEELRGAQR